MTFADDTIIAKSLMGNIVSISYYEGSQPLREWRSIPAGGTVSRRVGHAVRALALERRVALTPRHRVHCHVRFAAFRLRLNYYGNVW